MKLLLSGRLHLACIAVLLVLAAGTRWGASEPAADTNRYAVTADGYYGREPKDGVWHIRAGARVRVRVTMVAESRRTHVALVDPLPAGFEALNPSLAVTGAIPSDPKAKPNATPWWFWLRPWFEHQNLRDERAEAFTTYLYAGVHEYTYVARATTPGTFVVPPAKAEEMYAPETFGRSASDRVVVRAAP